MGNNNISNGPFSQQQELLLSIKHTEMIQQSRHILTSRRDDMTTV